MQQWLVSKSIVVKTNLTSASFSYRPIEDEFFKKFTFIAVGNISYRSSKKLNICAAITCNFVTERRYNLSEKRIEPYEVPLTVFQLKTSVTDTLQVFRITPIWFQMNSHSELMDFSIINLENNQRVIEDCEIIVTVFLK